MGRVQGKVAFITGVARGQGRAHAIRLAEEGADIIGVDHLASYSWLPYSQSTQDDLDETVALVEKLGRRIVVGVADVRDRAAMADVVERGVAAFGRLDIVCANAGITQHGPLSWLTPPEQWDDIIGVNLTGVWHTTSVAVPHLISAGGGSIIITSSAAGLKGPPNISPYVASKWAIIGFAKSLANEVASSMIRVNVLAPGNVATDMLMNESLYRLFRPDLESPGLEDAVEIFQGQLAALPRPWVDPVDIANAVLFFASDESRYVTGTVLPIDLGFSNR